MLKQAQDVIGQMVYHMNATCVWKKASWQGRGILRIICRLPTTTPLKGKFITHIFFI